MIRKLELSVVGRFLAKQGSVNKLTKVLSNVSNSLSTLISISCVSIFGYPRVKLDKMTSKIIPRSQFVCPNISVNVVESSSRISAFQGRAYNFKMSYKNCQHAFGEFLTCACELFIFAAFNFSASYTLSPTAFNGWE